MEEESKSENISEIYGENQTNSNWLSGEDEESESENESEIDKNEDTEGINSIIDDSEESDLSEEEKKERVLPEHHCEYCNLCDPKCVVKCLDKDCGKWFCNSTAGYYTGGASHIVQHLVRARHREVGLHPDSLVGDATLECYNCGSRNIFLLGFVPAISQKAVMLICREPCLGSGAVNDKDLNWDPKTWEPLISEKQFLPWLVKIPEPAQISKLKRITGSQIAALEDKWKKLKYASMYPAEINIVEKPLPKIPIQFTT